MVGDIDDRIAIVAEPESGIGIRGRWPRDGIGELIADAVVRRRRRRTLQVLAEGKNIVLFPACLGFFIVAEVGPATGLGIIRYAEEPSYFIVGVQRLSGRLAGLAGGRFDQAAICLVCIRGKPL